MDVQILVPAYESISPETLIEGAFIAADNGCEHTVIDRCEITRCAVGAQHALASPGKLHLGIPGGNEFAWDPGTFPVHLAMDAIPWAAGETITLRGDGKDVPAFTLSAPSPSTLNAGYDGPLLDLSLARTSPLEVKWTATSGDVVVTVRQDQRTDRPRTTIACEFSAASGTGVIPAAVLGRLDATTTTYGDASLRAWLATTTTMTAGDYAIRLRALRNWSDQYIRYRVN